MERLPKRYRLVQKHSYRKAFFLPTWSIVLMDNRNGPSLKKVSLLAMDDKKDERSRVFLGEREGMREEQYEL
jgi:hypothetical protein